MALNVLSVRVKEAGEIAQWLEHCCSSRRPDLGLTTSTMTAHTVYKPSSWGLNTLFCPTQYQACTWCTDMYGEKHSYTQK